jgi:hypothetical protein
VTEEKGKWKKIPIEDVAFAYRRIGKEEWCAVVPETAWDSTDDESMALTFDGEPGGLSAALRHLTVCERGNAEFRAEYRDIGLLKRFYISGTVFSDIGSLWFSVSLRLVECINTEETEPARKKKTRQIRINSSL